MVKNNAKQAFLIVTQDISKPVLRLYDKIRTATSRHGEVFILFHNDSGKPTGSLSPHVKVETFTSEILRTLGYRPIRTKLVPGSNHFPVLKFFLDHPEFEHYWCIEDDVVFSGDWKFFFETVNAAPAYDFVSSHIRQYSDMPDWFWWDTFRLPGEDFNSSYLISSFNPVYRISARALAYVDRCLKNGARGHHEVFLPTILLKNGYSIADLAEKDNHITPSLSLCSLDTMRWLPVFLVPGNKKNKLYHPVKARITINQLMEFLRRSVKKKKEYLT